MEADCKLYSIQFEHLAIMLFLTEIENISMVEKMRKKENTKKYIISIICVFVLQVDDG